ncbi:efflux RND transporter permease subunit [Rhodovulum euryhalinum]|uniref:Multidrug efflux pump subunit AcrB n=1 Tax=Rhodovulum euryhalinum TaxID=35805 RepID=A0A4R2K5L5_9RHOB|nr:efflux RND transporter permease subunit [Rhodovulum euryhalinum]TCO68533.1 multidrug efflux pump subunit AcrB [Rhodovulum euryhalinum]
MIQLFVRHPTAANILMLAIVAMGLAAAPGLQRDTFPVIPPSEVEVRIPYPGASPAEVERGICMVAEDPIRAVDDLAELTCEARDNLAVLTAEMVEGRDMTAFADNVKSAVEGVTAYPAEAEAPVTRIIERAASVATIAVTGPADPQTLFAYADGLAERLMRDPMISQATVSGFSGREIAVEISNTALRTYGLTIPDVVTALQRSSLDRPAGTLEGGDAETVVRFVGERRTALEVADLPLVSSALGAEVRLGDVATVTTGFSDASVRSLHDGQRAALVTVTKTEEQDTLRVMDAVRDRLDEALADAPEGIGLTISQDMSRIIVERLDIILTNGVMGLVLVLVVMGLFFGPRFSFWVAMTLPVSFLGTVFVMQLAGLTINMITMVALLVAIGLLMDDSIVISENIVRRRRAGEGAVPAAVNGVIQVLPGVVSSFLTTVLIVGSLGLMAGNIGAVLKFLPIVLVITLIVSLIEAFLILPHHLAHALHGPVRDGPVTRAANGAFLVLRERVVLPLARMALRFRYLTLGIAGALVVTAFVPVTGGWLKIQSFPSLESDTVEARFVLPQGTPFDRTEARVARALKALGQLNAEETPHQPGGQKLVQSVTVSFGSNPDAPAESGAHLATISAQLLPAGTRVTDLDHVIDRWRRLTGPLPDMISLRFTDRERGPGGKPIDILLRGTDLDELDVAARDMRRFFLAFPGVRDVQTDLRPGKPEQIVRIDPAMAAALGVDARGVAGVLRAALRGDTGLEVQDGYGGLDVIARLAAADRDDAADLAALRVPGTNGAQVPLAAVTRIEESRGYAAIRRIDGVRTVQVTGAINPAVANARDLIAAMRADFLPGLGRDHPGIEVVVAGEEKDAATTGGSLVRNLGLGLAGVVLTLAFQFRSFVQPLAVLVAIPLGVIGVTWGHVALGLQLSMPSVVGLATLAGVVVNNAILLVEFTKDHFEAGRPMPEAATAAISERFRAILLTALTTVIGLGPLLLEQSTQAQFLRPIVVSLAFGLTSATLLTLFVTPATLAILHDLGFVRRPDLPARTDAEAQVAETGAQSSAS